MSLGLASGILAGIFVFLKPTQVQSVLAAPIGNLIWPLSGSTTPDVISITSPFGPRWQASQNRYDYHPGLDIKADLGTPVHAIADGRVTEVGFLSADAGNGVVISHSLLNFNSAYLHLSAMNVVADQLVTQGQVIGWVGQSGTTEFNHLHFEIRLTANNYPTSTRNPMGYLPRSDVTTPTINLYNLTADPIFSPTVFVSISLLRAELDLNQITLTLRDRSTGLIVDSQMVNFNRRINAGSDSLDQNGIQLIPDHFNETATLYSLSAYFYNLHSLDSFTLTAQAADLAGHVGVDSIVGWDTTAPGQVTTLAAHRQPNGILLSWRAPGDSDFIGRAMTYEVRYAGSLLANQFDWSSGTALPNPPIPITSGLQQTWLITDSLLDPVYFALITYDAEGNVSSVSDPPAQAAWFVFMPLVIKAH